MSKPLSPSTFHSVLPTKCIQNLLTEIQNSAVACIAARSARCTFGMGSRNFSRAPINSGQQQIRVLRASSRPASKAPREGEKKKKREGDKIPQKGGVAPPLSVLVFSPQRKKNGGPSPPF